MNTSELSQSKVLNRDVIKHTMYSQAHKDDSQIFRRLFLYLAYLFLEFLTTKMPFALYLSKLMWKIRIRQFIIIISQ